MKAAIPCPSLTAAAAAPFMFCPGLGVAFQIKDWMQRHPWFPWILPALVTGVTAVTVSLCRFLAHYAPHDPWVVLVLTTMCALWTVPQQRWVFLHPAWLRLFSVHLIVLMQSVSAWSLHAWSTPVALLVVGVPNLLLTGYIAVCSAMYTVGPAPSDRNGAAAPYRRFVWSMYSLTVPALLVPQVCVLSVLSWLQDSPPFLPITFDSSGPAPNFAG